MDKKSNAFIRVGKEATNCQIVSCDFQTNNPDRVAIDTEGKNTTVYDCKINNSNSNGILLEFFCASYCGACNTIYF